MAAELRELRNFLSDMYNALVRQPHGPIEYATIDAWIVSITRIVNSVSHNTLNAPVDSPITALDRQVLAGRLRDLLSLIDRLIASPGAAAGLSGDQVIELQRASRGLRSAFRAMWGGSVDADQQARSAAADNLIQAWSAVSDVLAIVEQPDNVIDTVQLLHVVEGIEHHLRNASLNAARIGAPIVGTARADLIVRLRSLAELLTATYDSVVRGVRFDASELTAAVRGVRALAIKYAAAQQSRAPEHRAMLDPWAGDADSYMGLLPAELRGMTSAYLTDQNAVPRELKLSKYPVGRGTIEAGDRIVASTMMPDGMVYGVSNRGAVYSLPPHGAWSLAFFADVGGRKFERMDEWRAAVDSHSATKYANAIFARKGKHLIVVTPHTMRAGDTVVAWYTRSGRRISTRTIPQILAESGIAVDERGRVYALARIQHEDPADALSAVDFDAPVQFSSVGKSLRTESVSFASIGAMVRESAVLRGRGKFAFARLRCCAQYFVVEFIRFSTSHKAHMYVWVDRTGPPVPAHAVIVTDKVRANALDPTGALVVLYTTRGRPELVCQVFPPPGTETEHPGRVIAHKPAHRAEEVVIGALGRVIVRFAPLPGSPDAPNYGELISIDLPSRHTNLPSEQAVPAPSIAATEEQTAYERKVDRPYVEWKRDPSWGFK